MSTCRMMESEPRYILDPKEVHGEDFPGETFRVLKEKDLGSTGRDDWSLRRGID